MTSFARKVLNDFRRRPVRPPPNNLQILQEFTNSTPKAGGKVDIQISPRLSVFGRVGWRDADIYDNPPISGPSGGAGNAETYVTNKQFSSGLTYTPTGTSLFEARFGWSTTKAGKNPAALVLGQPPAEVEYGITGLPSDPRVAAGLPTQLITGFSDLGRQATNPQWQYPTVFNPKVNYTWLQGRHSLKTGYEFQRVLTEVQDVNPLYGRDSYTGQFSKAVSTAANNNLYNLADFMFGARSTYALSNILVAELQQNMHFMYLQDDWRVNDRLTLNAGLRYEYASPWTEANNVLSNFDPATRTMVMAKDGSLEDRSTLQPDRNNFGPRLGIAYTVADRTVMRAGYGISYVHFHRAGGANVLPINGPQVINAVVVQTLADSTFRTTQQGYPVGLTDPARFNPLLANITYMPEDYRSSDVHSWFASVQREIWDGALLDLAYVGNRANGMLYFANLNQAAPNNAAGTLSLQSRRPIPEYADITYSFNGGKSRYHAFQTKFDWRIGDNMTLLSSLTLSQTKDNGAGSLENPNGNFPAPQDFNNLDADYGLLGLSPAVQQHDQLRDRAAVRPGPPVHEQCQRVHRRGARRLDDRRHQHGGARRDGDADLHAAASQAGVGHPAGLPRRQQLSAERQRRSAGAGSRAQHQQLVEPHDGDGADRSEPAVRQRRAQRRARTAGLDGGHGDVEEVQHAVAERVVRVPRRVLQSAEPHELPRAERQPKRRRLRHDHDDLRSANYSVRL